MIHEADMADNNKKRTNSFRKIFPNIFFSSKPKEKTKCKNSQSKIETTVEFLPNCNQYENPRSCNGKVSENVQDRNEKVERVYENLTIAHQTQDAKYKPNLDVSNNSSSSTLVSESVKSTRVKVNSAMQEPRTLHKDFSDFYSGPQESSANTMNESHFLVGESSTRLDKQQYPDVYYHSVEKIADSISPIDQIEIYKASHSHTSPESVGAEIKRVSAKFLISPKKEAEVRTIQPTRARSLSFDDEKEKSTEKKNNNKENYSKDIVKKSYNYSAPTSPIPTFHKIPNMPKTVSPYGHVRKIMIEAEEKRNSLKRDMHKKSEVSAVSMIDDSTNIVAAEDAARKKESRQKVEAFYWQKLREMKQKEDEYLLERSADTQKVQSYYTGSRRTSPYPVAIGFQTSSLPRGNTTERFLSDSVNYSHNQFTRGANERRTDTCIRKRTTFLNQDIVYRHPDKMFSTLQSTPSNTRKPQATLHAKSFTQEPRSYSLQSKRVSFEDNSSAKLSVNEVERLDIDKDSLNSSLDAYGWRVSERLSGTLPSPPQPPVRTTSIGNDSYVVNSKRIIQLARGSYLYPESESGSEASEIQRILHNNASKDDWHGDGSRIDGGLSDGEASRGPARVRSSRRDDPRRHTLAGNHFYAHPHHPGQNNSHEMEYGRGLSINMPEYATVVKYRDYKSQTLEPGMRKPPLPRGYPPPNNALLFDDDPGIMSEVETSSTGFRRGGKQRSSLPVVRTPSKTLERPLGLVFLQYRNETKRALLPNEITSIDTVKALFVRSFPKQLTMQYMDSPLVKIYIHDSSKDMFYELEDVRAHLRDIRDRSVLRLFEATDMGGGVFPGAVGVGSLAMPAGAATCSGPPSWEQDQSYFSEPEIDSEYHHQHVHKTKVKAPAYYMGTAAPSTLPRGGSLIRAYSPAAQPVPADRTKTLPGPGTTTAGKLLRSYMPGSGSERCFPFAAPDCPRGGDQLYTIPGHGNEGYMSSPERGSARTPYEDPYYTQFLGPASGRPTITPVIDEESSDSVMIEDAYQMYGVNPITTAPRPMPRPPYDARLNPPVEEIQRLRVEKMERQLANLTGLVQKALQVPGAPTPIAAVPPAAAPRQQFQTYSGRPAAQDAARFSSIDRPPKLGRDKFQKSVSFEKSVSFSDDPPDMNSPIQHSPQHSERDRLKPAPPPKPAGLVGQQLALVPQRTYTINVSPDFFNDLRVLQKQSRDLRIETRNLRRSTLSHAIQMRQLMAETIVKIGALAASFYERDPDSQLTREEEIYRQDMLLLENDLYELEATVERLRGQAANRETRVNMADIERIAMVLSKSSKTVADWKLKFPILQDTMKVKLASEMEKVVRKEKMLEEEPERLELALRRCKKLTGTLVTLKRLACVQEQRLPITDGRVSPGSSQSSGFTAGPSSEEFTSETTCHVTNAPNKRVLDIRSSSQPSTSGLE